MALIGTALGGLGTRPGSRTSPKTGVVISVISIVMALAAPWPWPLFIGALLVFPILTFGATLRGYKNGVLPAWIVVAFVLASIGLIAGMDGSVHTDTGLALFMLPGFAGLLLAATALLYHGKSAAMIPASIQDPWREAPMTWTIETVREAPVGPGRRLPVLRGPIHVEQLGARGPVGPGRWSVRRRSDRRRQGRLRADLPLSDQPACRGPRPRARGETSTHDDDPSVCRRTIARWLADPARPRDLGSARGADPHHRPAAGVSATAGQGSREGHRDGEAATAGDRAAAGLTQDEPTTPYNSGSRRREEDGSGEREPAVCWIRRRPRRSAAQIRPAV